MSVTQKRRLMGTRAPGGLGLVLALLLVGLGACVHPSRAADQTLQVTADQAGFEPYQGGGPGICGPTDIPDGPAHASRADDGSIVMMASSAENYPFRGRSILHLSKQCRPLYVSRHLQNPALFDDRSWVLSPFSLDGRYFIGLVHDEFHGEKYRAGCPNHLAHCWYNAVTAVVSTDGSRSFHRLAENRLGVALPRYRFDQSLGSQVGYFGPTNIVKSGDDYAFMAYAGRSHDQVPGNCLLESKTPLDPSSWRAFDGQRFSLDLTRDPYASATTPTSPPCRTIAPEHLRWPVADLVFHRPSGTFIALMVGSDPVLGSGVFYATSTDLIAWKGPWQLIKASTPSAFHCGDPSPVLYPSLIDPSSTDRNFSIVGDHPLLFATSDPIAGCRPVFLRGTLIRRNVDIRVGR